MEENNITHGIDAEIAIMKSQMSHMEKVFDRISATLDKITELCNNSANIINLHEQKLREQDTSIHDLKRARKEDSRELHSRISTNTREIEEKMTKEIDKVLLAIKDLREKVLDNHDDLEKRIQVLERWRWILVGILIAGGFTMPIVSDIWHNINSSIIP